MAYAHPEAMFHPWAMIGPYEKKEFPERESFLTIPRVTYKHAGRYVCSAYNSVDQKKAFATVQVNCNYTILFKLNLINHINTFCKT